MNDSLFSLYSTGDKTFTIIPPSSVEISSASLWPLRSSLEGRITIEFSSVFVPVDWKSERRSQNSNSWNFSHPHNLVFAISGNYSRRSIASTLNLTADSFQTIFFFFKCFHVQNNEMIPHYCKVQSFSFFFS